MIQPVPRDKRIFTDGFIISLYRRAIAMRRQKNISPVCYRRILFPNSGRLAAAAAAGDGALFLYDARLASPRRR